MNNPAVILLHPDDNVVVCVRPVAAGERLVIDGEEFIVRTDVDIAHKIARRAARAGDKVVKYAAPIGSFTHAVAAGEWVHLHNMRSDYISPHTRAGRQETAA